MNLRRDGHQPGGVEWNKNSLPFGFFGRVHRSDVVGCCRQIPISQGIVETDWPVLPAAQQSVITVESCFNTKPRLLIFPLTAISRTRHCHPCIPTVCLCALTISVRIPRLCREEVFRAGKNYRRGANCVFLSLGRSLAPEHDSSWIQPQEDTGRA